LVKWFAPWVDPEHELYPYPQGDLLYTCRGKDDEWLWFEEPQAFIRRADKTLREATPEEAADKRRRDLVKTVSRTFIRSSLGDNPDLSRTDYGTQLASMPEELRRRYARGEFTAEAKDDEFQVIPTAWIEAAMARWMPEPPDAPMTAMGVDIAQGGADKTVLAPRYGEWFASLIKVEGKDTPDGPTAAALVVTHLRDGAQVNIDLGGGWGGSCYDHLKENDIASVLGVNPSEASMGKTSDGKLKLTNKRAEMLWRMREALDPSGMFKLALPRSSTLKADLTAAKWKLTSAGIRIEEKIEIKKRLGRSPDEGDAVCLAWFSGSARVRQRGGKRSAGLQAMSTNPNRNPRSVKRAQAAMQGSYGGGEQG
jgi:hypothetical protein